MHALVAAVLLRLAGGDALDEDPEPQPPHRELAQAEEGGGAGKGHAIVGADRGRQAKLLESPLKDAERVDLASGLQGIAGTAGSGWRSR